MIVRGRSLELTMSRYLCERIAAQRNIEVLLESEVVELQGRAWGTAEHFLGKSAHSGWVTERPLHHLFLLIGTDPNTAWLSQCDVELDDKGFVRADPFTGDGRLPFQTNRAGVFAIGDIRSGSIKRAARSGGRRGADGRDPPSLSWADIGQPIADFGNRGHGTSLKSAETVIDRGDVRPTAQGLSWNARPRPTNYAFASSALDRPGAGKAVMLVSPAGN